MDTLTEDFSEGEKNRDKRRIRVSLVVVLIAAVCAVGAFLWFAHLSRVTYASYALSDSVSVSGGNSLLFVPYQGGVVYYGRDGITATDASGQAIFGAGLDMANPQIDVCGQSIVVADIGQKTVFAYNGGDTGVEFTVDYPIALARISSQGVVAVLTQEDSSDTISLYNPFDPGTPQLLAEIPTNVEDGYPVSMDISPDGTGVVTAYLCITAGTVQSRVTFCNFTDVGKNANNLVGAHNYNKALISEVQFLSDSTVCLFSEKGFYLWQNMKQPVAVAKKEFSREIKSAFTGEEYVGVILAGDSEDTALLRLFDGNGEKKMKKKVSADYTAVMMDGDEILLSSSLRLTVLRTNGTVKYDQTLENSISYFFPCKKKNSYFVVQESQIKVIKVE